MFGANTTGTVAAAVEIHPVNAERLLIMLTAMELVHRLDDGTYTNADDVDRYLVKEKKSYAGPWMLFNKPQWDDWGLGQAIFQTQGVAHSEACCIGYFATAGFVDVTMEPFIPGTWTRITGNKPA